MDKDLNDINIRLFTDLAQYPDKPNTYFINKYPELELNDTLVNFLKTAKKQPNGLLARDKVVEYYDLFYDKDLIDKYYNLSGDIYLDPVESTVFTKLQEMIRWKKRDDPPLSEAMRLYAPLFRWYPQLTIRLWNNPDTNIYTFVQLLRITKMDIDENLKQKIIDGVEWWYGNSRKQFVNLKE